jgi:putative membrane protein
VHAQTIRVLRSVVHPGEPLSHHDLWTVWSFEPSIIIPILLVIAIYVWGMRNVWQRAGRGHGISRRQWLSFVGAILMLVLALVSPLDALSSELFSAHMVQHLLLILAAAPLLVLSDFQLAFLWILPRGQAQTIGSSVNQTRRSVLTHPIFVWVFFAFTMWIWHAPALYEAALRNEGIHTLEHLLFLFTAILFWWVLFKHTRPAHIHFAMTIPFLFLTVLQSTILGALMTFTSQPWYAYYAASAPRWGLTLLQDQQLAGIIMWIPGGAVFTLLTIGYFAAWLRALEKRSEALQRQNVQQKDKGLEPKARLNGSH